MRQITAGFGWRLQRRMNISTLPVLMPLQGVETS